MGSINISYKIVLNDSRVEVFDFQLSEDSFDLVSKPKDDPPEWAKLEHQQCSHCPLSEKDTEYCPLALQLHEIVDRFHDTKSIDQVEMEVITLDRRVIQKTDIQRVIASMLDLIFPSCGCPKTECMRPMSRFHLPLASEEERVFRVTGMYLLAQYFLKTSSQGGRLGFKGLIEIYEDLHILNVAIAKRLRSATSSDSAKNAVTLLDMYSTLVPMLLEDELAEMRSFFKAYLPEIEEAAPTTNYFEKFKELSFELVPTEADERPLWMRQLDPDYVFPEDMEPEELEALEETEADRILKKSSLKIALEPLAPEKDEDSEEPSTPFNSNLPNDANHKPIIQSDNKQKGKD